MLTGFKSILLLIITTLFSLTNMNAQNLLTNGGFEGGGSGNGFLVHNYALINPVNGTSTPGKYAITKDPSVMNSSFISGDTIFTNLNWITIPLFSFTNLLKK